MTTRPGQSPPIALTIAGSDSGGGAGIQADLKTFHAFGCFGTSVLTALTAQNTRGVSAAEGVRPELVLAQLTAVLDDLPPRSAKTGMLFSAEIIAAVRSVWEARAQEIPLVIDPVMVATSGDRLLRSDAERALAEFLPLARLVTPNLPEAAVLLGVPPADLYAEDSLRRAALDLSGRYRTAVLLKGGHRARAANEALDFLVEAGQVHELRGPWLSGSSTHGTGCTLSAAIAAGLARGMTLLEAVSRAKQYVTGAIANAPGLGSGNGPLNHLWESPGAS